MARLGLILSTITALVALLGGFRYVVDTIREYRWRKRQTGKWLAVLALCLMPGLSDAANHYIRDGGLASTTGTGACTTWETANACDTFPATLIRGDTYYVADGTYAGYTFDAAKSGVTLITIKKATVADHGTETGWVSTYGDGQAIWSGAWVFSSGTGYYVFDGVGRTTETSGHGFRLGTLGVCGGASGFVSLATGAAGGSDHITVKYTEIVGEGYNLTAANTCGDRGIYSNGSSGLTTDITLQYLYIHDMAVPFLTRADCTTWIVEYSVIANNYSSPASHAETWSDNSCDNIIIRWNKFLNPEGTASFAFINNGTSSSWEFYGNVWYQQGYTCGTGHNCGTAGVIYCANDGSNNNFCDGFKFFNNTIYDFDTGTSASRLFFENITGVTAPIARNNIWATNASAAGHVNTTLSHNWYWNTTHTADASDEQTGTGDPFVNAASADFRLTASTNAGSTTSNPSGNTVDMLGVTRGSDGVWDRGAMEYVSGGTPGSPVLFISQAGGMGSLWAVLSQVWHAIAACLALWSVRTQVVAAWIACAAALHRRYWQIRYRCAVARWQRQAPVMLPEPGRHVTIEPRMKVEA